MANKNIDWNSYASSGDSDATVFSNFAISIGGK